MEKKIFSLIVIFVVSLGAFAEESQSDYVDVGYDSIVKELSKSRAKYKDSSNPLESVKFHGGVGFIASFINVEPIGLERYSGFIRGFQANLGIDLFSKNWIAETSVRSFGSAEIDENAQVNLQEFDLKVIYKTELSRVFDFRAGAGLAARYLELKVRRSSQFTTEKFTTPSSIFTTGLEAIISDTISLGAEVAYRSSLIEETADRSAIDAGLRIDAHF